MKIAIPAGASVTAAGRRLCAGGFWLPRLISDAVNLGSSNRLPVTVTGGGTAHTMGAWAQLVLALSEDVGWVGITQTSATNVSATDSSTLLNLGVGGAGSEVVVLDSLGVGYRTVSGGRPSWLFPIFIPRGSRVAAQAQGARTSQSVPIRVDFYAPTEGVVPSRTIPSLGAVAASSRGTILTLPANTNTPKSAWTQIVAATTEPYTALGVSAQGGGSTVLPSGTALLDIGTGAAGSEVAVIKDLLVVYNTLESADLMSAAVHPLAALLPAGSRLSARWQVSTITTPALDVILHGIRPAA